MFRGIKERTFPVGLSTRYFVLFNSVWSELPSTDHALNAIIFHMLLWATDWFDLILHLPCKMQRWSIRIRPIIYPIVHHPCVSKLWLITSSLVEDLPAPVVIILRIQVIIRRTFLLNPSQSLPTPCSMSIYTALQSSIFPKSPISVLESRILALWIPSLVKRERQIILIARLHFLGFKEL